jgi:uroporphyrinogen III methyltransferase/synthase
LTAGIVYLVGAGPGDPGLLTLRGRECLAAADLVLYDGLANPLLLRWTRGECVRTSRIRGEHGGRVEQDDVNARLIAAAREGKTVVRLKGGDPFLFGRGSEEAAALAEAGIPLEVVPGVTAAIAAGEYAGISFTHRRLSSAVAFVTGHEDPAKDDLHLDYAALARFPGTLVFYMGLHRLRTIAAALLDAGMPPATPAAVVCSASLPAQRTVVATLATLADAAEAAKLRPPSLIVVGDCVRQREQIAWFERRPLFGLRVGITRPEEVRSQEVRGRRSEVGGRREETGLEATIARCLELGAEPVLMPLIEVRPVEDWSEVDTAISRLSGFDWLVFTSANGVRALLGRLWEIGGDARRLAGLKLACIGPATAEALAAWQVRADLVPGSYRAEDLAAELAPHVEGQRVLWARASRGRDVLPDALADAGATVEQVVVYDNVDAEQLPESVAADIAAGRLDWIGLSSPSIARRLAALWPQEFRKRLGREVKLAAISPVTAAAAEGAGLPVAVTAQVYTWDGLFDAIIGVHPSK